MKCFFSQVLPLSLPERGEMMSTKFISISIYTTEPAPTRDELHIQNIRAISPNMNMVTIQGRFPEMDSLKLYKSYKRECRVPENHGRRDLHAHKRNKGNLRFYTFHHSNFILQLYVCILFIKYISLSCKP